MRLDRHTQGHIAAKIGLYTAAVSRICRARGLSRLDAIEPKQPRPRYERDAPGELVHIDVKRLGTFNKPDHRVTGHLPGHPRSDGAGHEFAHVAIDDHSRIAHSDIRPDEKKESAVLFSAANCWLLPISRCTHRQGHDRRRIMLSLQRLRQRLPRPQHQKHRDPAIYSKDKRKAERFIQTALREWAYATEYHQTPEQRRAQLPIWLHRYDWHRPHTSLGKNPPISRLRVNGNNLLQLHS